MVEAVTREFKSRQAQIQPVINEIRVNNNLF